MIYIKVRDESLYFSGHAYELCKEDMSKLFTYRHDVFVKQLGWRLELSHEEKSYNWEIDQFDHDETVYVFSKDGQQNITSCARLLPTTKPYLLEQVFPKLLGGKSAPKSQDIWELSRFSSMSPGVRSNRLQFGGRESLNLLNNTIEAAKGLGAKYLISVSPLSVERLLRKNGFSVVRVGPAQQINGYSLVGCCIDLH